MGKQNWKPGNMLNPVPAVMVSVTDKAGNNNIITVAWAGTVCTNPPMLSISVRPETTEELLRACDYCGVKSGRDVDKFKELHLTPLAMQHVSAVGISQSPVNIECRVRKIEELGSHTMFIADVVGVTVDDKYMDGTGKFHINDTGLVMYSHGEYFGFGDKLGSFGYSVRKTKK